MADYESINFVMLVGWIASEIKHGKTKDIPRSYARFNMATTEVFYTKGSKEKKFRTEFHNIICWGKLAKVIAEYGKKGIRLGVEGRLRTAVWTDEGKTIRRKEVQVDKLIFMTKKSIFEEDEEEEITEESLDDDNEGDPF